MVRNVFGLVFMMTLVGAVLVITGLMGWQPPNQIAIDAASSRRGIWSDHILLRQVSLGLALLVAAGIVVLRINRQLTSSRS